MKLREIKQSATVAWSTEATDVALLAIGTMAGTMSDTFDSTGSVDFYAVDFSKDGQLDVLAQHKTEEKMNRLCWGGEISVQGSTFGLGILAGAMDSGVINLWNPTPLIEQSDGNVLFASAQKHSGAVKGIDFNPFQFSLLASGGLHGEVFIWDLNSIQPYAPGTQKSPSGESDVVDVQWNKKVKHILATTTASGMTVIWDLRAKRAVLNFKDGHTPSCSAMAWSPDDSTTLVTACDDNSHPVVQLWDLKNTFTPKKTFTGHTEGVLSLSWSHTDSNLLLSGGKDKRAICWNVNTGEAVGELETCQAGWVYNIQWAPTLPTIVSTCSLPGNIELHSVHDIKSNATEGMFSGQKSAPKNVPTPNWLVRPTTATFGFGGKLITIPVQKQGTKPPPIKISHVVTNPDLVQRAQALQNVIKDKKFIEFCDEKTKQAQNSDDQEVWEFLKVLFGQDARTELLKKLGFNREQVSEAALFGENNNVDLDIANLPTETETPAPEEIKEEETPDEFNIKETPEEITFSLKDSDESLITKSLLVGNFQAAVDACFRAGRYADGLVLAACGGKKLLVDTQAKYLSIQKSPFMQMVSLIVKKQYEELINRTDLSYWKEVLAILCTYAEPAQFFSLCEILGDRLAEKENSKKSALLCYICAGNLEKTTESLVGDSTPESDDLQNLIEKITIFGQVINNKSIGPKLSQFYALYAEKLASEGLLDIALYFIRCISDKPDPESSISILDQRLQTALSLEAPVKPAATKTGPKNISSMLDQRKIADQAKKPVVQPPFNPHAQVKPVVNVNSTNLFNPHSQVIPSVIPTNTATNPSTSPFKPASIAPHFKPAERVAPPMNFQPNLDNNRGITNTTIPGQYVAPQPGPVISPNFNPAHNTFKPPPRVAMNVNPNPAPRTFNVNPPQVMNSPPTIPVKQEELPPPPPSSAPAPKPRAQRYN